MTSLMPTELPPDVNRGPEILAICCTMMGLAIAMVLLRVYVRMSIIRQFGWDDWSMTGAALVLLVEMIIIISQVKYGVGRHVFYLSHTNITVALHLNFIAQPLCLIVSTVTKVSIGLFLLRWAPIWAPKYKYFIWILNIFTILSGIGAFLTVFVQCQPLAATWDSSVKGECLPAANLKAALFFNSALSCVTDLLFVLLPIPMMWTVQLNKRSKYAVIGILSLGGLATIASIVKFPYINSFGSHGDFTFDSSDLLIWTTVENCTAILAACAPALKPLFKSIFSGTTGVKSRVPRVHTGYSDIDRMHKSRNGSRVLDLETCKHERTHSVLADEIGGGVALSKQDSEESIFSSPKDAGPGKSYSFSVSHGVTTPQKSWFNVEHPT